jgi:hypothetical protein
MKYFIISILVTISWYPVADKGRDKITLSKAALYDKIKGGWAGQLIGVTYASEMKASASAAPTVNENLQWSDGYQISNFQNNPDVYDDIYIDLTFLEAIREHGAGVTPKKLSEAYLRATYTMNHACQSARYNLMKGKSPQRSGYWLDNPHADDNDFQSHADFIGLMYPGLPQSASLLSNKVGHLMNYGDGYYGGLYISTLYSLAFTTKDLPGLVSQSLNGIPKKSTFYQCVNYAIEQHSNFPYAWDRALGQFQRKWGKNFGCPDRLIGKEDADAKMNAAYITLALLYGQGDFDKTLQIIKAIRPADCNVATVAGVLGVMSGFEKIPDPWKQGIDEIEAVSFPHSSLSLADACDITFREALNSIENSKGKITKDEVTIVKQTPEPGKLEKSFEGHYPKEVRNLNDTLLAERIDFNFEGIGFVLRGVTPEEESDEMFFAELYLNNKYIEVVEVPMRRSERRPELLWKFQLPHDSYTVSLRPLTRNSKLAVKLTDLVVYDVTPN